MYNFAAMALPIFFADEAINSNIFILPEDTSRHVVQVLRMQNGEALQLTDGMGNLHTAEVIDAHKKKCTVRITHTETHAPKTKQVSVAISLLKNASRFEWFLEKATEVGATDIVPLLCERTEKQHFRYERMRQILIAAMMQSQQAWLPVLHEPLSFKTAVSENKFANRLVAHCEEGQEKTHIRDFATAASVQVLIGPEGDFTPAEIELALQHGYQPVTLGSTRLRAETAGVVAATLLCV